MTMTSEVAVAMSVMAAVTSKVAKVTPVVRGASCERKNARYDLMERRFSLRVNFLSLIIVIIVMRFPLPLL